MTTDEGAGSTPVEPAPFVDDDQPDETEAEAEAAAWLAYIKSFPRTGLSCRDDDRGRSEARATVGHAG